MQNNIMDEIDRILEFRKLSGSDLPIDISMG
jgi:hypothetical protein